MNRFEQVGPRTERIALAGQREFLLGATRVNPPMRTITTNESVQVEPRVMQVLVALHDADGSVLSRDRLIDLCWGGVVVGDDAINRAIAELRRAGTKAGADFEVETIPKIGYRLKVGTGEAANGRPLGGGLTRRSVTLGAAAIFATGLGGLLWSRRGGEAPQTQALLADARRELRAELPDRTRRAIALLDRAVQSAPDNAEAAGLLAMAWRNAAEFAPSDQVSAAVQRTDQAARHALRLDPNEGNALTALATLQPYMGDWVGSERKLLEILEIAPDTLPAISHLTTIYQSAGLLKRSKVFNDRALALDPLSPVFQFRAALKHWILGDAAAADLAIDRAQQVWPNHPGVWNARLMLFAFTGRTEAARAVLDNPALGPQPVPSSLQDLWRVSLDAIGNPQPRSIEHAAVANIAAARQSEGQAVLSMMMLSTIGRIDEAYDVARGYFLSQGRAVSSIFAERQIALADQAWKRSMMLFTPATLAMRRDSRFAALCHDMGLAAFWQQPGHAPDYAEFDEAVPRP